MRSMRCCLGLWLLMLAATAARAEEAKLVEVKKIWDQAPHNAFTDLIRYKDAWFCTFREGRGHVSPDGALRVLTSKDGEKWESAALVKGEKTDLRDSKFSIAPDGRLMLIGAGAMHPPSKVTHQSYVWFSDDGHKWGDAIAVGDPDNWLWRITWHKEVAYGVGYATVGKLLVRLYRSEDGRKFETLADDIFPDESPNETSMIFLTGNTQGDGTGYCLLRRDGAKNSAQLGVSHPPYKKWEWKDLGHYFGGPHMIRLPDGRFFACGRMLDGKVRTSVCSLDPKAGKLTELVALPSGGDTSYPGLVWHDNLLWISYYSSHEGKTNIYLAKVDVGKK